MEGRTIVLGKDQVMDFLLLCDREQLCHELSSLQDLDLRDGFRGHYFQIPHLLLKYGTETMASTKNVFVTEQGKFFSRDVQSGLKKSTHVTNFCLLVVL